MSPEAYEAIFYPMFTEEQMKIIGQRLADHTATHDNTIEPIHESLYEKRNDIDPTFIPNQDANDETSTDSTEE
jgi:hypothetical protein